MMAYKHVASLRAKTEALVYAELKKKRTLTVWRGWHGDGSHTNSGNRKMSCGNRVKAEQLAVRAGLG